MMAAGQKGHKSVTSLGEIVIQKRLKMQEKLLITERRLD